MKPKIVRKKAFLVVGMRYVGKNQHGEISKLWDRFMPRMSEIRQAKRGRTAYGLEYELSKKQGMEYIAGLPVKALKDIPRGMVGREVPAQTYAVLPARGLDDILPTYRRIDDDWLPGSDYEHGEHPDLEFYDAKFNPEEPKSIIYVCIPVRKKKRIQR